MWKSFENIGLQTSEKVSWEKTKHAQNIRSTVHRTGDLITRTSDICRTFTQIDVLPVPNNM